MQTAYLIIAQNNPKYVEKIIKNHSTPGAMFFIHLDKNARLSDYADIKGHNIHFSKKRIPVRWGDFSMVQATFILIRQVLTSHIKFDKIIVLHESDFSKKSGLRENYSYTLPVNNKKPIPASITEAGINL